MMIRNFIFLSMCLLGIVASVSAQYQQNHQQLFIDPIKNEDTKIIAEALEPVEVDDRQGWLWTGNWNPSIFDNLPRRPLLVKMSENMPLVAPFSIEWAMTYLFPGEENGQASPYILDVRDVHHVPNTKEYILCGQFKHQDGESFGGFLLKTDHLGYPTLFRFYPAIQILNSVVSKSNSDTGYIAVGTTLRTQEDPNAAAFLSVDYSLNPVCVKRVHGTFRAKGRIESYFKKVIPYGQSLFATVGTTSHKRGKDPNLSSQNVLVSIFDDTCNAKCNNHFGGRTFKKTLANGNVKYTQFFETGESLADFGNGKGLVVTGNTRKIQTVKNSKLIFDDILLFRTRPDCSLRFMRKYDVDRSVSSIHSF